MWLLQPDFKECIGTCWRELQVVGWEGYKFIQKLQVIKEKFKSTNNLEGYQESGVGSTFVKGRNSLEAKTRVKWSKEQDCNSKYFHKMANGRRKKKLIKSLVNEEDVTLDNQKSILEKVLGFFRKLYSKVEEDWCRLESLDQSPISKESASNLEQPFLQEEIQEVVFHMDKENLPNLNGFTLAFYQDCLDIIKQDFNHLIKDFSKFHKNATFMVLVPKKSQTNRKSDFKPINLVTSLQKILAKVLAQRLQGVLHETIHISQGVFVKGGQILDVVLVANEVVDEKRHYRNVGVVFKIDFEKTYEHVK